MKITFLYDNSREHLIDKNCEVLRLKKKKRMNHGTDQSHKLAKGEKKTGLTIVRAITCQFCWNCPGLTLKTGIILVTFKRVLVWTKYICGRPSHRGWNNLISMHFKKKKKHRKCVRKLGTCHSLFDSSLQKGKCSGLNQCMFIYKIE